MKKIDLGQALTILANIGVIAGIIFLGIELRQNRELARAQMRNELTSETLEITRADINGPIAEILALNRNGDALTDTQQVRFGIWRAMWNAHIDNIFFQYQEGLYPKEALDQTLSSYLNMRGNRDRICGSSSINADLRSYLQAMMGETCQ